VKNNIRRKINFDKASLTAALTGESKPDTIKDAKTFAEASIQKVLLKK
jgi:hypothetical protein